MRQIRILTAAAGCSAVLAASLAAAAGPAMAAPRPAVHPAAAGGPAVGLPGASRPPRAGWNYRPPPEGGLGPRQPGMDGASRPPRTGWGDRQFTAGWGNDPSTAGWGNEPSTAGWGNEPSTAGWGNEPSTAGWGYQADGATPGFRTTASVRRPATVVRISPDLRHAAGVVITGKPPTTAVCKHRFKIACYQPAQIREAYGLPALRKAGISGRGETIVIVDSFGSPTVRRDLAAFDRAFHLAPPPSLRVIQPAGKVPAYRPTSSRQGWAGETDLDVEWAHAMAPGARILLVETPTAENEGTTGFPDIVRAEKYVIRNHLGGVITQSFSATEQTFPSHRALLALRSAYRAAYRAGVTVLAASGDSGAADVRYNGKTYYLHPVTSWPDSDPLVTGIGGTRLTLGPGGRRTAPDQAWNDTGNRAANEFVLGKEGPSPLAGGGGRSVIFGRPGYQSGVAKVVGDHRGVPDISMSAACNGAVDVYQSFGGQTAGWYPTCGTSEATPLFAGIVTLAEQLAGHPLGLLNPRLYALAAHGKAGITDITAGNNTVSFRQGGKWHRVTGFPATKGYDLASGLGTVGGPAFVYALAGRTR